MGVSVGETRELLWVAAEMDLSSVHDDIEAERRRIAAASLGVCEECESGWVDQDDPHQVAPCPYCQPEKYGAGGRPWDRFPSIAQGPPRA